MSAAFQAQNIGFLSSLSALHVVCGCATQCFHRAFFWQTILHMQVHDESNSRARCWRSCVHIAGEGWTDEHVAQGDAPLPRLYNTITACASTAHDRLAALGVGWRGALAKAPQDLKDCWDFSGKLTCALCCFPVWLECTRHSDLTRPLWVDGTCSPYIYLQISF